MVMGYAEYIQTTLASNASVSIGTPFVINTTAVFNSVPTSIMASSVSVGTGTVFTLNPGTYVIDYELSLDSVGSVAFYTIHSSGPPTPDLSTISGSSTPNTWIHGRFIKEVTVSQIIALCPRASLTSTLTVTTPGSFSSFNLIRITILKIK